jgi:hypothetical protein
MSIITKKEPNNNSYSIYKDKRYKVNCRLTKKGYRFRYTQQLLF